MPRPAVDGDRIAAAAGDVIHDGSGRIELFALLVEIGGQQTRAASDPAHRGGELADQQFDQRGFSAAVGTDDPDAVAALYARGKIRDDRRRAEGVRDVDRFEHQLARRCRVLHANLDLPDAFAAFTALDAQLLEGADSALVARAPRLHALPDPNFLLRQLLVEQCGMLGLDFESRTLLHQIVVIAARPNAQPTAVEFHDPRRQAPHERPIVADE